MSGDRLRSILSWLRSPQEDLRRRVLHGGVWATALNVTDRALQIGRLVVLARLLAPSDFGLMGIALLVMTAVRRISELGIDPALVQRKEDDIDPYLGTVWVMKIIRGLVMFVVLFSISPLVATFFGESRAEPILRVLALSPLIFGFTNPAIVYFEKKIEFQKQYVYRVSGTVVDLTVAVVSAIVLQNVWALVYGVLAGNVVRLVVSYLISDFRPKLQFKWIYAEEILDFGKWIWATGMVTLLATSGDDAFVGWYLTAGALGLYQLGFRLSNAPATEVTHVISKVMFPAYSELQDDTQALRRAFSKTMRVVYVVAIPMTVGIILISPEFVRVVLGEQWLPMVPAMQIMAVAGFLRAIAATGGALFQGYGQPEWDFRMNVGRTLGIVITIWPFTSQWGITGAAASITVGIGLTIPIWVYKTVDITGAPAQEYLQPFVIPAVSVLLMAAPVYLTKGPTVLRLVISTSTGIMLYPPLVYLGYRLNGKDPLEDFVTSLE